jgi:hypothetical protein
VELSNIVAHKVKVTAEANKIVLIMSANAFIDSAKEKLIEVILNALNSKAPENDEASERV